MIRNVDDAGPARECHPPTHSRTVVFTNNFFASPHSTPSLSTDTFLFCSGRTLLFCLNDCIRWKKREPQMPEPCTQFPPLCCPVDLRAALGLRRLPVLNHYHQRCLPLPPPSLSFRAAPLQAQPLWAGNFPQTELCFARGRADRGCPSRGELSQASPPHKRGVGNTEPQVPSQSLRRLKNPWKLWLSRQCLHIPGGVCSGPGRTVSVNCISSPRIAAALQNAPCVPAKEWPEESLCFPFLFSEKNVSVGFFPRSFS